MGLNPSQLERYRRDGFLVLPRCVPADDLARYSRRFEDLVLGRAPRGRNTVVMRDVMVARGVVEPAGPLHGVNKLMSFEDDPVLFHYVEQPALIAAVRALVGPRLITISTNVFNKPPGVDGRHPLHQDLRYFKLRPADGIVAAWTAIDRCSRENGCLAVVPGSHRRDLCSHALPDWEHVNHAFFAAAGVDLDARVHVEMEPGDTLLFHPLLVHGSGRNRSSGFRRAISTHYASADCVRPGGPRRRDAVVRRIADPQPGRSSA